MSSIGPAKHDTHKDDKKDKKKKDDKKDKDKNKEHPDAAYIKRDDIGLVIAKGLAVMYKAQPQNPCDFLAKWLLNYA